MTFNASLVYWGRMKAINSLVPAAILLALAACGSREPLRPKPGQSKPAAPAMAARAPTTEEMLAPPPIAKPTRTDETLTRSEEREDDRFDLPPPG